jgi:protein SCO1/2
MTGGTDVRHASGWAVARRIAWGAVAAALFAAGALMLRTNRDPIAPTSYAAAIGGPFELTDPRGRTVTDATLRGRPFAIFFGFTRCPEVCPTTLNELSLLRKELGAAAGRMNIVFVSLDPAHDTPKALGDYLTLFDAPIIGLTGTQAQLERVTDAYGVYSRRVPLEGTGDYTIDHTATVFLMGAQGEFIGSIDMHEPRKTALEKLRRLVRA